jgi:hypothetical protein
LTLPLCQYPTEVLAMAKSIRNPASEQPRLFHAIVKTGSSSSLLHLASVRTDMSLRGFGVRHRHFAKLLQIPWQWQNFMANLLRQLPRFAFVTVIYREMAMAKWQRAAKTMSEGSQKYPKTYPKDSKRMTKQSRKHDKSEPHISHCK